MSKPPPDRGEMIFSPEQGVLSPAGRGVGRQKPGRRGQRDQDRPSPPQDGIVRVSRERRRGKGVTLLSGIPLTGNELRALGKALKQRCGCGGTIKDGVIEIQGDHRDLLLSELAERGYEVKRVGG